MTAPKTETAAFSTAELLKHGELNRKGYHAYEGVDLAGNVTIIVEYATMDQEALAAKAANKNGNKSFAFAKGQIEGVQLYGKNVYGTSTLWTEE